MDFKITHLEQATRIQDFDDKYLKVYRSDGLCTFLDTKTLNYAFGDKWFKKISWFNYDYYIVTREDGLKTLLKTSDGEFVNKDLWFEKWEIISLSNSLYCYLVHNKNGCTPLREDFSYVCKDKWAKTWWWFDGNLLMRRDDNLSTIVSIKDGSYMYDNVWFASWENFSSNHYLVETSNGLKTLISKKYGSLAYNDLFAYQIYNFGDKFLTFKNKKYGTFLSSIDLKEVSNRKFMYQTSIDTHNIILLRIYQQKKIMFGNFSNKAMLAKYDSNTNEYTLISNDVFESNYTILSRGYSLCPYVLFFKANESAHTVVRHHDAKIVLDSVVKFEPYEYSNSLYLVTREDGKKTMFDENTNSYVNESAWFDDFTEVGDYSDLFLVTKESGIKTLVKKSDLSYVFADRWFQEWDKAYPKYYMVRNGDEINFVSKTDGSLLFGKDSKKKENIIISSNWAINKFTIYVLEDETLRVYTIS